MPPISGEMTQLAAIPSSGPQATADIPAAAIPAPTTPPTTAWVVDTGAPIQVARFTHSAEESRAAIIAQMKASVLGIRAGFTMPLEMVSTTSPPAMIAPAVSKMAAISSAPDMVSAFEPTAGPTLLVTSLAPMFIAM